jgi:hypothetical protein
MQVADRLPLRAVASLPAVFRCDSSSVDDTSMTDRKQKTLAAAPLPLRP